MANVKITVVKRIVNDDLIEMYGAPGFGICDRFQEGDVYISKGGNRPDNFPCEEAWYAFDKYAFALAHGADGFWESWIPERKLAVSSCNDGLRPVIFKLETIEE